MYTRIYTRTVNGQVGKWDVAGRITHKQAKILLKEEGILNNGAILLIYKESENG